MPTAMRAELMPHPDFPCPTVRGIAVEAQRDGCRLVLTYLLDGDLDSLLLPAPAAPRRADGLWRHSCFEAFVAPLSGEGYFELNFSPSGEWAGYRFDAYRSGMADLNGVEPRTGITRVTDGLALEAELEMDAPGPWRLGLSAVIEATDGSLSYWALRHPPGKPDFHHPYCFALELAPAA